MNKINLLLIGLIILISAFAISIFLQDPQPPEQTLKEQAKPAPAVPVKKPIVHYPVPQAEEKAPETVEDTEPPETKAPEPALPEELPPVELSDESVESALQNLKFDKKLFSLILNEGFIQRLVTTIDSLPEKKLPTAHLPLVPPSGRFIVSGTAEAPQTSQRNFARYDSYIKLLEQLDEELVVKIYVHFYPLFQKAYRQLGYKNAYFNDRLVNVIDHLLDAPDPPEPILLTQPSVLYAYADPLLEELSVGQKALLRVGPQHRIKVKQILKNYRYRLVDLKP